MTRRNLLLLGAGALPVVKPKVDKLVAGFDPAFEGGDVTMVWTVAYKGNGLYVTESIPYEEHRQRIKQLLEIWKDQPV